MFIDRVGFGLVSKIPPVVEAILSIYFRRSQFNLFCRINHLLNWLDEVSMKPKTSIYEFEISKNDNLSDSFKLKAYAEHPDTVRFCDLGDAGDSLRLPWMQKEDLVAWLRKAATLIEKTELE